MNLTDKQKAFCDYYLETLNATEAAIKAGYSKKTARKIGSENLTKPDIKNYIDKRLKELEDARIAKVDEVMKFLTSSLRGEVEEEVVSTMSTMEGETKPVIIKKQISARDRIKAAELIGRRYQLFTDKVNVDANIGVTIIDDLGVEDD